MYYRRRIDVDGDGSGDLDMITLEEALRGDRSTSMRGDSSMVPLAAAHGQHSDGESYPQTANYPYCSKPVSYSI